jgi:putative PIN family toxin of toxin-antitoxin system
LCVSTEILEEYEEILYRLTNKEVAANIIDAIVNNPYTLEVQPFYKFNLIQQDPDDNKFVDCAIVSHARYLVTEDKHFRVLNAIDFPAVTLLRLQEFILTLSHQGQEPL